MTPGDDTSVLLERYYSSSDESLLERIFLRHREWLHGYVRRRMGPGNRVLDASEDVVQDVFMALLRRGPAFIPPDDDAFRRLVATIVINRLRDRHRFARAARRDVGREEGAAALEMSRLAPSAKSVYQPSREAAAREERQLVELAFELIDSDDAVVLRLRNDEGLDFPEIGERLEVAPDAARMRFNRAVRKLGAMVKRLQQGRYEELAPDLDALD